MSKSLETESSLGVTWGTGSNCQSYGAFLGDDENVLELVVMAAQLGEYAKHH